MKTKNMVLLFLGMALQGWSHKLDADAKDLKDEAKRKRKQAEIARGLGAQLSAPGMNEIIKPGLHVA